MKEAVELIQQASFLGIFAGAFVMSSKTWLRHLWSICLMICVGCGVLLTLWDEITAFCSRLLTYLSWGALAIAAVVIAFKLIRRFLIGRRV